MDKMPTKRIDLEGTEAMRKLFWCLTALGTLTLSLSAGLAQERTPSNTSDRSSTYSQPGQTTASQSATPLSRLNFLSRNSGEETAAQEAKPASDPNSGGILRYQRARPADQDQESRQSATGLQNYHRELFGTAPPPPGSTTNAQRPATPNLFVDPAVRPAGATQVEARKPAIIQAGGFATEPAQNGITQADFVRPAGTPEPIQQTSSSAGAPLLPTDSAEAKLAFETPLQPSQPSDIRPLGRAPQAAPARGPAGGFVNFSQDAPHIETRWTRQSDINVGQPCDLLLTVKNSGQANAADVVVDVFFPRSVRLTAASPKPVTAESSVVWEFAALDAGEEREIHITMIPTERGELAANANVRFSSAATTLLAVEEPMLKLAMSGPKEVMMGESASHVVTVSNPGT